MAAETRLERWVREYQYGLEIDGESRFNEDFFLQSSDRQDHECPDNWNGLI